MFKRAASALLWFLAGWYGWSFIASATDLAPVWGPILGTILAAVIAGDPMHRIWAPRGSAERVSRPG